MDSRGGCFRNLQNFSTARSPLRCNHIREHQRMLGFRSSSSIPDMPKLGVKPCPHLQRLSFVHAATPTTPEPQKPHPLRPNKKRGLGNWNKVLGVYNR